MTLLTTITIEVCDDCTPLLTASYGERDDYITHTCGDPSTDRGTSYVFAEDTCTGCTAHARLDWLQSQDDPEPTGTVVKGYSECELCESIGIDLPSYTAEVVD